MEKNFLSSLTIWGTIMAVLPTLLGPVVGGEDANLVGQYIDQIITGLGGLLAVFGRFRASAGLKLF